MKNPAISRVFNHFSKKPTRGFTLIEVLIVIAIISILMTAGVLGLKDLAAGKGTSSAIATCESLFNEARSIAISKRCKARLMVDVDDADQDNYLRRLVIAHERINDDGTIAENEWVLASRGYVMPNGTYFSGVLSKLNDGTDIPEEEIAGDGISSRYAGRYAYYQFNSEGVFENPGASFIVGAGVRPKGQEPRITKSAERDFAGFVIWRNGRTSAYRSPEQMDGSDSLPNNQF